MAKKIISKRLNKVCIICGREIKLILYKDRNCRGGHYFGKVPVCSREEMAKALKSGSHKTTIAGHSFDVLNHDPKPHTHFDFKEIRIKQNLEKLIEPRTTTKLSAG